MAIFRNHLIIAPLLALCLVVFTSAVVGQEKPKNKPVVVSGKVVTADGKPAKGAFVCGNGYNTDDGSTLTDANGEFTITIYERPSGYAGYIWAYLEGHGLRAVSAQKSRKDNHEIVLSIQKPRDFRVIGPDGTPLANAVVRPDDFCAPNGVYSSDRDTGLITDIPEKTFGDAED